MKNAFKPSSQTAIISGLRNSGFAQSDVAYWAYTGTGTMEGKEPAKDLRTIAALFEEHIHLVTLKKSKIKSVKDLKGKKVSLDEPGSGTYVDALLILEANGLSEKDLQAEALKGNAAKAKKILKWKPKYNIYQLIDDMINKLND